MNHVVIFDQGNKSKPYDIITEKKYLEMVEVMETVGHSNKWLYTDLFTGTEDECLVFCKRHNLKL